jgi:hypothetical protein
MIRIRRFGAVARDRALQWMGYDCFLLLDDVGTRTVYLADQANDILTNAFTLSRVGAGRVKCQSNMPLGFKR